MGIGMPMPTVRLTPYPSRDVPTLYSGLMSFRFSTTASVPAQPRYTTCVPSFIGRMLGSLPVHIHTRLVEFVNSYPCFYSFHEKSVRTGSYNEDNK